MAPSRRKGSSKAAAAAAARRQWKVGDLVLAKVKGFPAWPAKVCAMRYLGEKLGGGGGGVWVILLVKCMPQLGFWIACGYILLVCICLVVW
jgi:hypothetical protein